MFKHIKKIVIFLVLLLFSYQIVGCGSSNNSSNSEIEYIASDLEIISLGYAIKGDFTEFTFKVKNNEVYEDIYQSKPTIVSIYSNNTYVDEVDISSLKSKEEKVFSYVWNSKEGIHEFKFELNKKPDGTYFSDELNTENNLKEISLNIFPKYITLKEFEEITKDDVVVQDLYEYMDSNGLNLVPKNSVLRIISDDITYYISKLKNNDANNKSTFTLLNLGFQENNATIFLPYIIEILPDEKTLRLFDSSTNFLITNEIANIYVRTLIKEKL